MSAAPHAVVCDHDDIFCRLLAGKIESVALSVDIGGTEADVTKPNGVYVLTAEEFRVICAGIAEHQTKRDTSLEHVRHVRWNSDGSPVTPEQVASRLDLSGTSSRWFRLSKPVAEWLNSKEPLVTAGHIG